MEATKQQLFLGACPPHTEAQFEAISGAVDDLTPASPNDTAHPGPARPGLAVPPPAPGQWLSVGLLVRL
jgi:hypothetical protein